jgi:hypothetical protein
MMNCRTLGEAFEKSGRYQRIIGNLIEARAELVHQKGQSRLLHPTPRTEDVALLLRGNLFQQRAHDAQPYHFLALRSMPFPVFHFGRIAMHGD